MYLPKKKKSQNGRPIPDSPVEVTFSWRARETLSQTVTASARTGINSCVWEGGVHH